jgi:hypothetical protein
MRFFYALFRQNAVVRGPDGHKLTASQVRDDIKSGRLKFFVSRTDPNPNVCDKAEEKAQSHGLRLSPPKHVQYSYVNLNIKHVLLFIR